MAKSSFRPYPCVGQASPCSCKRQAHGPLPGQTGQLVQQDSALLPHAHPQQSQLSQVLGTCSLKKHSIELGPCPGDERSIP